MRFAEDVITIAASGNYTVTPPVGEVWMMRDSHSSASATYLQTRIYNGTIYDYTGWPGPTYQGATWPTSFLTACSATLQLRVLNVSSTDSYVLAFSFIKLTGLNLVGSVFSAAQATYYTWTPAKTTKVLACPSENGTQHRPYDGTYATTTAGVKVPMIIDPSLYIQTYNPNAAINQAWVGLELTGITLVSSMLIVATGASYNVTTPTGKAWLPSFVGAFDTGVYVRWTGGGATGTTGPQVLGLDYKYEVTDGSTWYYQIYSGSSSIRACVSCMEFSREA